MEVDKDLPPQTKYWLTAPSKNDCFFIVGSTSRETERIGAIKVVLFAQSEPLQNMLEGSELAEQGDVRVEDIEPGTFKTFLKCIYGGSDVVIPKLSFQESVNLLYVIEKYMITEIKPKVVSHALQLLPLTFDNIFCALSNPVCFSDKKLEKAIMKIIECNTDKVFESEMFLQLSSQSLLRIVKAECLDTSEINIWNAVIKWAMYTTKSRNGEVLRKQILSHLEFIRFCTFGSEEFCKRVIPFCVLTCEEVNEVCKCFGTGKAPRCVNICNYTVPRSRTKVVTEKTFYHIVNDITGLKSNYESQMFKFNKYSWNILLGKCENSLKFYLCCGGRSKRFWSIPVAAEVVLINQQGKPNFSKTFTQIFNKYSTDGGYSSFYPWNDLLNVSNGFIKNNTIIVMVDMKIEE